MRWIYRNGLYEILGDSESGDEGDVQFEELDEARQRETVDGIWVASRLPIPKNAFQWKVGRLESMVVVHVIQSCQA